MGVGHGAPQSPAERDEAPGAHDPVEEHCGDHCSGCATREHKPRAHGRFDRAAAAGEDRDRRDKLAERVGNHHPTDRDRLAHGCEGREEGCSVEQPVEKAEGKHQQEVIRGDLLLRCGVRSAQMSDGPSAAGTNRRRPRTAAITMAAAAASTGKRAREANP